MPTPRFSVRHDTRGTRTGAYTWTGEVQSLAHVTASTVATLITIPGRDFLLVATTACHIVFGNAGVNAASVTAPSRVRLAGNRQRKPLHPNHPEQRRRDALHRAVAARRKLEPLRRDHHHVNDHQHHDDRVTAKG